MARKPVTRGEPSPERVDAERPGVNDPGYLQLGCFLMAPSAAVGFILGHGLPEMVGRPPLGTEELVGLALASFVTGILVTEEALELARKRAALARIHDRILLGLYLLWPVAFVGIMTTVARDLVGPVLAGIALLVGVGVVWVVLDERRPRSTS